MITEQIRVEQNAELNLASLWNDHAFFNYVIHTWPISGKIMQSMIAWLSWIFLSPLFTELLSQHFRVQAEAFNIFWFFFWLKNGYVWCRFNSRKIRPTVFLRALMNDFIKTHTHTHSVPIMDHGSLTWSLIWPVCIKKVKSWHGTMKCFSDANTPI